MEELIDKQIKKSINSNITWNKKKLHFRAKRKNVNELKKSQKLDIEKKKNLSRQLSK